MVGFGESKENEIKRKMKINRKYKYINDIPMKCHNCEDLSKGMIGVAENFRVSSDGLKEQHFEFDNGFLLEESFLIQRSDLFKRIEE